jgi:hypothetical protein
MNALEMPRKTSSYRIDERVAEAIKLLADRAGLTPQHYLEQYFFAKGKEVGIIPPEAIPLGALSGGKRQGSGKPKGSKNKPKPDATDQAE